MENLVICRHTEGLLTKFVIWLSLSVEVGAGSRIGFTFAIFSWPEQSNEVTKPRSHEAMNMKPTKPRNPRTQRKTAMRELSYTLVQPRRKRR